MKVTSNGPRLPRAGTPDALPQAAAIPNRLPVLPDDFVDRPSGAAVPTGPRFQWDPKVDKIKPLFRDTTPVVVVLDGGADYRHTDLDDAMWKNPGEVAGDKVDNDKNGVVDDVFGYNIGANTGDPLSGAAIDHGTHIGGIFAAEDNGVGNTGVAAGKVRVMSVGGLYDRNNLLTNFERGVDYIVRMRNLHGINVRVVNASFGNSYPKAEEQARWNAAIQRLADADILLVAATANGSGSNMNEVPDFPANSPLPNVLTIAAMDTRNDKLAGFSSHGDKVVELAAVGERVFSTLPGNRHGTMSGTSMATPTVGGAAGLVWAKNPRLTAPQVREIILKSVDKDDDLKGKVSTEGKLNVQRAVEITPPPTGVPTGRPVLVSLTLPARAATLPEIAAKLASTGIALDVAYGVVPLGPGEYLVRGELTPGGLAAAQKLPGVTVVPESRITSPA